MLMPVPVDPCDSLSNKHANNCLLNRNLSNGSCKNDLQSTLATKDDVVETITVANIGHQKPIMCENPLSIASGGDGGNAAEANQEAGNGMAENIAISEDEVAAVGGGEQATGDDSDPQHHEPPVDPQTDKHPIDPSSTTPSTVTTTIMDPSVSFSGDLSITTSTGDPLQGSVEKPLAPGATPGAGGNNAEKMQDKLPPVTVVDDTSIGSSVGNSSGNPGSGPMGVAAPDHLRPRAKSNLSPTAVPFKPPDRIQAPFSLALESAGEHGQQDQGYAGQQQRPMPQDLEPETELQQQDDLEPSEYPSWSNEEYTTMQQQPQQMYITSYYVDHTGQALPAAYPTATYASAPEFYYHQENVHMNNFAPAQVFVNEAGQPIQGFIPQQVAAYQATPFGTPIEIVGHQHPQYSAEDLVNGGIYYQQAAAPEEPTDHHQQQTHHHQMQEQRGMTYVPIGVQPDVYSGISAPYSSPPNASFHHHPHHHLESLHQQQQHAVAAQMLGQSTGGQAYLAPMGAATVSITGPGSGAAAGYSSYVAPNYFVPANPYHSVPSTAPVINAFAQPQFNATAVYAAAPVPIVNPSEMQISSDRLFNTRRDRVSVNLSTSNQQWPSMQNGEQQTIEFATQGYHQQAGPNNTYHIVSPAAAAQVQVDYDSVSKGIAQLTLQQQLATTDPAVQIQSYACPDPGRFVSSADGHVMGTAPGDQMMGDGQQMYDPEDPDGPMRDRRGSGMDGGPMHRERGNSTSSNRAEIPPRFQKIRQPSFRNNSQGSQSGGGARGFTGSDWNGGDIYGEELGDFFEPPSTDGSFRHPATAYRPKRASFGSRSNFGRPNWNQSSQQQYDSAGTEYGGGVPSEPLNAGGFPPGSNEFPPISGADAVWGSNTQYHVSSRDQESGGYSTWSTSQYDGGHQENSYQNQQLQQQRRPQQQQWAKPTYRKRGPPVHTGSQTDGDISSWLPALEEVMRCGFDTLNRYPPLREQNPPRKWMYRQREFSSHQTQVNAQELGIMFPEDFVPLSGSCRSVDVDSGDPDYAESSSDATPGDKSSQFSYSEALRGRKTDLTDWNESYSVTSGRYDHSMHSRRGGASRGRGDYSAAETGRNDSYNTREGGYRQSGMQQGNEGVAPRGGFAGGFRGRGGKRVPNLTLESFMPQATSDQKKASAASKTGVASDEAKRPKATSGEAGSESQTVSVTDSIVSEPTTTELSSAAAASKKPSTLKKIVQKDREARQQKSTAVAPTVENIVEDGELTYDAVRKSLHNSRFRPYCENIMSEAVDQATHELIVQLKRYQDRAFAKDKSDFKIKYRKRVAVGLRQVLKLLRVQKVKCVIIAPDLEESTSKGGLYYICKQIVVECQKQNVPYVFALSRSWLAFVAHKHDSQVSCLGLVSVAGAEETFKRLLNEVASVRAAYDASMLQKLAEFSAENNGGDSDSLPPSEGVAEADMDEFDWTEEAPPPPEVANETPPPQTELESSDSQ